MPGSFPRPDGHGQGTFHPRALLAPAQEPPAPTPEPAGSEPPSPVPPDAGQDPVAAEPSRTASSQAEGDGAVPAEDAEAVDTEALAAEAAAMMRELGMEPAPCTPEAHALLAEEGISPRPAPGEPLGPDDEHFSPIAIGHLTHRLLDVKRFLEQLTAEQKAIHDTLRLAHLRGDLLHLLAPSSEGWCYQLGDGVLLNRRQGRKQWSYSALWAELEAQLKARQTYEQATGEATWRHGAAFWEIRGQKG